MTFIVQRLACYDRPDDVADALREEFGVAITAERAARYDASRGASRLARKWRELFAKTRRAFHQYPEFFIATANKTVRIELLAKAARHCLIQDYGFVAQVLNQILDEIDGIYAGGVMGDDRRFRVDDVASMTPAELDAELDTLRERARGCDMPAGRRLS